MEDYTLHAQDGNGKYYLPNLHNLIDNANVLYANKIKSQVKHGTSSDGQLIYNTGLLPMNTGAAAMYYGRNKYPNYAHLYDVSILSNPTFDQVWNQYIITSSFGYNIRIGGQKTINDNITFQRLSSEYKQRQDSTICYLAITMDSHSPFNSVKTNPTLQFDSEMPISLQQYLNCLHFTDSCFGAWYNEWKKTETAKKTVLVITGDHTVFKDAMLQELMPYAQKRNLSIASGKTYCPLIIQTPQIAENIQIMDTCYQMDVYPTILHLIGAEDYFWKGFGVNLLDSTARRNRLISEEEAYQLSDKLIRSNYFATFPIDTISSTM